MTLALPLIVFFVAMVLQGLFAGYETAFISLHRIRLQYLVEEEESKRAARLLHYLDAPDRMITALLVGTNLMVITCTVEVSLMVQQVFPSEWAGAVEDLISAAIVAPVMLIFAEIIPKSVFRTHAAQLAMALLPAIDLFYAMLAPITIPVTWLTRLLFRAMGYEHHHLSSLMSSLEDVRAIVDEGVDHGTIEPEEQEMIHSVIDLQTTTAKAIMVPRIAIQALPETATRTELAALFAESGRTRIAIYRDSLDAIVGVVNAYALLMDPEPDREDIARFVKEVTHVPDTMKVGDLFREMKESKQHLAIVADEYGGTDGLVTIEDILEEIFGEIQDEYDDEESPIHKLGPNAYVVDARTTLEQASEVIGLPIRDDDVETVGGWLMHVAGHIPQQGEVVEHGRFRMTVLAGKANFVSRIRLEVIQDGPKVEPAADLKPPGFGLPRS